MNTEITEAERAALEVLRSTGVDVLEAALVAKEARECGSAAQYRKARAILSGVFSSAIRHDWCDSNPVARVEVPEVEEKPIEPLSIQEVERLEEIAQLPEHEDMQLSLHQMLYCGIRPTEVSRIDPERDRVEQGECPPLAAGCLPPYVCHVSRRAFQGFPRIAAGDGA